MQLTERRLVELQARFRRDPNAFFRYYWPSIKLWPKLEELNLAVAQHRRVAIRAGHAVGKTWDVARLALWWLSCFPPAKVVTTAPTWGQVADLLWSEIQTAYKTAVFPIGGRLFETPYLEMEPDCFAVGISPQDTVAEREMGNVKGQGYHSPNLLVILDEAAGVPKSRWDTFVDSLPTGSHNHVVAPGNPNGSIGRFHDCFTSETWHKIQISCLEHPNVVEGREVIPGAVSREWVEEKRREWGEGSNLWKAKVLGEEPDEGDDTLFPLSWVEQAMRREGKRSGFKRGGCDVARFGEDKTTFCVIDGTVAEFLKKTSKEDTRTTAGRCTLYVQEGKVDRWGIDDTGVGGGVTDSLRENDVDCEAFNFGEAAREPDRFVNRRAEVYWHFREGLDPSNPQALALPKDDRLLRQLTSIRWSLDGRGRIKLESKDELKKRLGHSPDEADGLVIAYSVSPDDGVLVWRA